MNNIKQFDTDEQVLNYINNIQIRSIGKGTEGYVSLTKDNDTVKYILSKHRIPYSKDILTSYNINLKSFIFPTELILHQEHIAGYRAEYFKDDIFICANRKIDLHDLLEAREIMIKDVKELSKEKYIMSDIEYNLLFNGKRFMAIDTLDYKRIKNLRFTDNLYLLDNAIKYTLNMIDHRTVLYNHLSVEKMVKKLIKENGSIISIYKEAV